MNNIHLLFSYILYIVDHINRPLRTISSNAARVNTRHLERKSSNPNNSQQKTTRHPESMRSVRRCTLLERRNTRVRAASSIRRRPIPTPIPPSRPSIPTTTSRHRPRSLRRPLTR